MLSRSLSCVLARGSTNKFTTRCFSPKPAFEKAQEDVNKLGESDEVSDSLPGRIVSEKKTKYGTHAKLKGTTDDDDQKKYDGLISSLVGADAPATQAKSVEALPPVQGLEVSTKGKVFEIRLSRPSKFNALTFDMYNGIAQALYYASAHKETSVTVMTAAGDFYCAGNDLSNFAKAATASKEEVKELAEYAGDILETYTQAFIDHEKPLITLCQGPAVGIGCTVLPLCDMVIASDKFTCNTPFTSLGQSPEAASSYSFPLIMGPVKAAEFLLMGRKLMAEEAASLGLVSMVVPHAQFEERAWKEVKAISELPPESLRLNKILLRNIHREALIKAYKTERELIVKRWQSKECADAIAAFMKRKKK